MNRKRFSDKNKNNRNQCILHHNFSEEGNSFDDRLIDLIKEHPIIYDVTNSDYRRNAPRQEIWRKISRTLGASSKFCQVKWKNIRYSYLQELKNPKSPNVRRRRVNRDLSFLIPTAFAFQMNGQNRPSEHGYIYKPQNQNEFYEILMVDPSEDDESTIEGASSKPKILDKTLTEVTASDDTVAAATPHHPDHEVDIKPIILDRTLTEVTASDDKVATATPHQIQVPEPAAASKQRNSQQITEVATSSVSDFRPQLKNDERNQTLRSERDRATPSDAIEMYCLSLADSLRAMNRSERERVKFEFANILKDAQYHDNI